MWEFFLLIFPLRGLCGPLGGGEGRLCARGGRDKALPAFPPRTEGTKVGGNQDGREEVAFAPCTVRGECRGCLSSAMQESAGKEGGKSAPGAFSVRGRYSCSRVLSEGMGRTCSPSARRGQDGSKGALLRACSAGGGPPCPTRFPYRGRRGWCGQYRRKKQTHPFNTRFLMGRGVRGGKMGVPKGVFCQREVPLLPCTVGILLYPSHAGKKG